MRDFVDFLGTSDSLRDLENRLSELFADLGVSFLNVGQLRARGGAHYVKPSLGTLEHAWRLHYKVHGLEADDQTFSIVNQTSDILPWDALDKRTTLTPSMKNLLSQARDFGLTRGFTVPVWEVDGALYYLIAAGSDEHIDSPALFQALDMLARPIIRRVIHYEAPYDAPDNPLTPRQTDVMRWLSQGKTESEIAMILGVRASTVHSHVSAIYDRLGVHRRESAVVEAFRRRIL